MYNELELDSIYENMYEYYVNDYIIFEGVLRRDYYECIGVLTEDGNKNFLKNIWEKIIHALKSFKEKIKELITKIRDKMLYNNEKKLKTIWNKYFDVYKNENGKLNEFTMKNFKPFNPINTSEIETIFDIDTFSFMKNIITDEDIKKLQDKLNNIDKLKEDIHNKIWINKKVEYPFKEINGLKKYIESNILKSIDKFIKNIDNIDKYYEKEIEKKVKDLNNDIKEYEKEIEKDKDDMLYNNRLKRAQNSLKAINLGQTILTNEIKILTLEFQNLFRESIRLYIAGGKYLMKNSKTTVSDSNNSDNNKYITEEFKKAVDSDDKLSVKIMLKDSLLIDKSFDMFDNMVKYANKNIKDLYDDKNDDDFESDKEKWNEKCYDCRADI
jgi:hypothetical protein